MVKFKEPEGGSADNVDNNDETPVSSDNDSATDNGGGPEGEEEPVPKRPKPDVAGPEPQASVNLKGILKSARLDMAGGKKS